MIVMNGNADIHMPTFNLEEMARVRTCKQQCFLPGFWESILSISSIRLDMKENLSDLIVKREIGIHKGISRKNLRLPPFYGYILFLMILIAVYLVTGTILADIPVLIGWIMSKYLGLEKWFRNITKVKKKSTEQLFYTTVEKTEPEKKDEKREWIKDGRRREFIELCKKLSMKRR